MQWGEIKDICQWQKRGIKFFPLIFTVFKCLPMGLRGSNVIMITSPALSNSLDLSGSFPHCLSLDIFTMFFGQFNRLTMSNKFSGIQLLGILSLFQW
jgi:hypothetical protein